MNDGEVKLWQEVLIQALVDTTDNNKLIREQARAWFEASIGTTVADFNDVCLAAGFEPSTVRKFYRDNKDKLSRRILIKMKDEIVGIA